METTTICRCCIAYCGIVVETADDGETIERVRGDDAHPVSHGYTCPKGRALPDFHHRHDRLDTPSVRGRATSWDECLDDLAATLRPLLNVPDSIGVYRATGMVGDAAAMRSVYRTLGYLDSQQLYATTTIDIAPAFRVAELVTGSTELSGLWIPEDEEQRFVLFVGANPVVSHGYQNAVLPDPIRHLRDFRRRGGRVWVMDPRTTETARLSDHHIANRPDSDAVILAWLVRELLIEGCDTEDLAAMTTPEDRARLRAAVEPFTVEVTAAAAGVATSELEQLLAEIRAAGRIAVAAGTGVTFSRFAMLTEWMRWALLVVTGSLDRAGGMWFNPGWMAQLDKRAVWDHAPPEGAVGTAPGSRPELARLMGQAPCAAMVDEIETGRLRALIVVGGSPLTAFPDPERVERALRSLDALVVCDVIATPLTAMATHVFPAADMLERTDMLASMSPGQMMWAPAVVAPAAERKPVWWPLAQLARRLGSDILDGIDPDDATDESLLRTIAASGRDGADALVEAGPHGCPMPRAYGWVRRGALPGRKWRVAPTVLVERLPELVRHAEASGATLTLVSRRAVRVSNSSPYAADPKTYILVHPEDAATFGLEDGDHVVIESEHGEMPSGEVRIDRNIRHGVVSASHGSHEANVCRLTSNTDLDPLSGQPIMSGLPVRVRRVGSPLVDDVMPR